MTSFTAILVYVDDMVPTGTNIEEINSLDLQGMFKLKDLGTLRYFFGIEVARSVHGISIC